MAAYYSYIICTSPRSGSTLLCKLLASTKIAGNPNSYFHRPSVSAWCDALNLTQNRGLAEHDVLEKVFRAVVAEGSLETGMFGLRLQRHSFDFFVQKLAVLHAGLSTDLQRLLAAFGRTSFIHLTRQDKVEQAVSLVKAEQTGLWHIAPDGRELERLAPGFEPEYDGEQIRAAFDQLNAFDRAWRRWFEAEGIEPLRITYEALASDPIDVLRRVLDHLGLDSAAANDVTPEVAKLADRVNEDWARRFRAEENSA